MRWHANRKEGQMAATMRMKYFLITTSGRVMSSSKCHFVVVPFYFSVSSLKASMRFLKCLYFITQQLYASRPNCPAGFSVSSYRCTKKKFLSCPTASSAWHKHTRTQTDRRGHIPLSFLTFLILHFNRMEGRQSKEGTQTAAGSTQRLHKLQILIVRWKHSKTMLKNSVHRVSVFSLVSSNYIIW